VAIVPRTTLLAGYENEFAIDVQNAGAVMKTVHSVDDLTVSLDIRALAA
jgi:hypothetical protein